MADRDIDYFRRRETEERQRARTSKDRTARCIHADMAERYSAKLRELIRAAPPLSTA